VKQTIPVLVESRTIVTGGPDEALAPGVQVAPPTVAPAGALLVKLTVYVADPPVTVSVTDRGQVVAVAGLTRVQHASACVQIGDRATAQRRCVVGRGRVDRRDTGKPDDADTSAHPPTCPTTGQ
jgi:hypothetical protein